MQREKRRSSLGEEITLGPERTHDMPSRFANIARPPRTSTGRSWVCGALRAQMEGIHG